MQPELQRLEVQRFAPSDHDLSVEHALPGKLSQQRRDQVRVVPRKWLRVPALQVDLALVTKDEHAETIPLGLEDPVATRRKVVYPLGEHRKDRTLDDESHDGGYLASGIGPVQPAVRSIELGSAPA